MQLSYFFSIEGNLYKPVLKSIEGRQVIEFVPVRCGTCKFYVGCERMDVFYTRCEKWKME